MPYRDAEADVSAKPRATPADEDFGPPGDAVDREANPAIRASTALMRTRAASQRDAAARVRDLEAAARDELSRASDRAGRRHAETPSPNVTITDVTTLVESPAEARARAASDREHAAADRAYAAADRARAADDRRASRIALRDAHLDELTGAYTRGPGLLALQHEVARAHRADRPFVLALIDIDGLRRINARDGHPAGDAMLRAVTTQLRARLRSYDVIVRVGGDELLCAFSDTRLPVASRRIREVQGALPAGVTISSGLAELGPGEMLDALTVRADAALDRVKRGG